MISGNKMPPERVGEIMTLIFLAALDPKSDVVLSNEVGLKELAEIAIEVAGLSVSEAYDFIQIVSYSLNLPFQGKEIKLAKSDKRQCHMVKPQREVCLTCSQNTTRETDLF